MILKQILEKWLLRIWIGSGEDPMVGFCEYGDTEYTTQITIIFSQNAIKTWTKFQEHYITDSQTVQIYILNCPKLAGSLFNYHMKQNKLFL
jgi:hypothetical protein